MLAGGRLGDVGEEIEIPLAVDAALAALAGTARASANDAAEAHEARVGAAQRRVGARVGARVGRPRLGQGQRRELVVGAQDGGHVGSRMARVARVVVSLGRRGSRDGVVVEAVGAVGRQLGARRQLEGLGAAVGVRPSAGVWEEVPRLLLRTRCGRHDELSGHCVCLCMCVVLVLYCVRGFSDDGFVVSSLLLYKQQQVRRICDG